jgi:hypothetical protein
MAVCVGFVRSQSSTSARSRCARQGVRGRLCAEHRDGLDGALMGMLKFEELLPLKLGSDEKLESPETSVNRLHGPSNSHDICSILAMKRTRGIVLLTLVFVSPRANEPDGQTRQKEVVSDTEIGDAIRAVLTQSWDRSPELFYRNPEEATKLVIAELRPTKRGRYPGGAHPQAVWIVRALRSVPGLDFTASTRARLRDDEAHFLRVSSQGEVEFFATWMLRDSDWVAPKDAQVAIIKKWQEW